MSVINAFLIANTSKRKLGEGVCFTLMQLQRVPELSFLIGLEKRFSNYNFKVIDKTLWNELKIREDYLTGTKRRLLTGTKTI